MLGNHEMDTAGQDEAISRAVAQALQALDGAPRREKTLAVAKILFVDYGVYPSAKEVLAHIGHGSYTDIGKDLKVFWAELRGRLRTRFQAPEIPDALAKPFGEALGKLWEVAIGQAQQELRALRQECEDQVERSRQELLGAQRMTEEAQQRAAELEKRLDAELGARMLAQDRVAALEREVESLQGSVSNWMRQSDAEAQARREAEARFAKDLEAERSARHEEAQRYAGEVRFAKLQIEEARASAQEAKAQFVADREAKDLELATYRQRMNRAEEEASVARAKYAEAMAQKKWLEGRVAELQDRVRELAKAGVSRALAKKPAVRRKSLR